MKRIILMTLALFTALTGISYAQSRGSYFFENSLLRSKLNPAFAPKTSYATMPAIGSFSTDIASNVGLSTFVYPEGDKSYLFLNDRVPSDTFLSKLPSRADPYLQERLESDLFGAGMRIGQDGFATVGISLVESGGVTLSGDMLRFAKTGSSGNGLDITGAGDVQMAGYAALSLGYSHDLHTIVEGLRAGIRLKLLVGLAAARFTLDRMGLQYGETNVSARTHGNGALAGIGYNSDGGFSLSGIGLGNMGAAADLGVSYRFPLTGWVEGIELSASVCDLGTIRFGRSVTALSLDRSFSFSGIHDFGGDIKAEFEQVIGEARQLFSFETREGEPFSFGLSPSIHAGASAFFLQGKGHAGLLYYHTVGRSNLMAACGYTPFPWLNLGINWTFIGPANRFGFYSEVIPRKYLGLFFGMESASWQWNSSHIPIRNFTETFTFGLNVLFGD